MEKQETRLQNASLRFYYYHTLFYLHSSLATSSLGASSASFLSSTVSSTTLIVVFALLLFLALLTVGLRRGFGDLAGCVGFALVLAGRLRFSFVGVASVGLNRAGLPTGEREGEAI